MPTHDVAVADMGASREHAAIEFSEAARQHVLRDLDSRNGSYVNGVRVDRLTPLQTGDLVRIGETDLRYASAAPQGAPRPEPSRETPKASWLRELHVQRRGFLVAAAAGATSAFLPWTRLAQGSTPGVRSALGVLALLAFAGAAALSLLRDRTKPLERPFLAGALAASSLGALLGIVKLIVLALDPAASAGLGVPLAVLAGLASPVALWFTRAPAPPADAPATPDLGVWARVRGSAVRAGETTVRLFKNLSGKKARERAQLSDRRDRLLEQLGEAALRAAVSGPEADAARKAQDALAAARERFEKVGKETSARDLLIAKSDLKWAETRRERALRKLGRLALDRAVPLEGQESAAAEVKALDERLGGEA
jgi:hypothetical protein